MEEQENDTEKAPGDDPPNDGNDDDSDDSDDDDINVVIGDIKSGPSYNIKQRAPLLPIPGTAAPPDKANKQTSGKFSIDEFECVGTISGVPAPEFSIDSLDDKPWRKPGADITDYFNYGFNEETWRAYCERQKHMRLNESGVGLAGLSAGLAPLTSIANDNGTYVGGGGLNMGSGGLIRRAGPPPGRKVTGQIDVIGSNGLLSRRELDGSLKPVNPAKENVIQVMTAERREYSRPTGKYDGGGGGMGPPPFGPGDGFFDSDDYNYGYEPTQEHQWINDNPGWVPSGIKELTPGPQMLHGPQMVPPPMGGGGMMRPPMGAPQMVPPPHIGGGRLGPPTHMGDRDRERDRERDRMMGDRDRGERERDRDREREYRERERGKSEVSGAGWNVRQFAIYTIKSTVHLLFCRKVTVAVFENVTGIANVAHEKRSAERDRVAENEDAAQRVVTRNAKRTRKSRTKKKKKKVNESSGAEKIIIVIRKV